MLADAIWIELFTIHIEDRIGLKGVTRRKKELISYRNRSLIPSECDRNNQLASSVYYLTEWECFVGWPLVNRTFKILMIFITLLWDSFRLISAN